MINWTNNIVKVMIILIDYSRENQRKVRALGR